MNDFNTAVLLLVVVLVPVGLLIFLLTRWEAKERRKRLEAMRRRAQALGFAFAEEGDAALLAELDQLVRIDHKHSPKVFNVMRGERRGVAFEAADYSFVTGGGKSHQLHRQTVVRIQMPFPVPELYLRPEHVFDKIGDWMGWHDIDFDHRPDFSRRYFLRGRDESAIRAFFADPALGMLEHDPDRFCMGGKDGWLLIYRPYQSFVAPEELEIYLDRLLAILATFRGR